MTDFIDPQDKIDALSWAIQQLKAAPEPESQLDRNRMHILQLMRDQAQREARR